MTQNPYGRPLGHPYSNPGQPPNPPGNGNQTLVIVLSIVGGVVLLFALICGGLIFMVNRTANQFAEGLGEVMEKMEEENLAQRQELSEIVLAKYSQNPKLTQEIGDIKSSELRGSGFGDTYADVSIDLKGSSGNGVLQVESVEDKPDDPDNWETHQEVYLYKNGQKILIDKEANKTLYEIEK